MIRTLGDQFARLPRIGGVLPPPINVMDANPVQAVNQPAWSQGGYAAMSVGVQYTPQPQQNWKLVNISVTASIYLAQGSANASSFGKLGKVLAGLVIDGTVPVTSINASGTTSGQIWVNPMNPLPADNSLVVPLFDPSTDSLPPIGYGSTYTAVNPVSGTISPPVPIQMVSGEYPVIGIWVTPSLLGSLAANPTTMGLVVVGASYRVTIDDGL